MGGTRGTSCSGRGLFAGEYFLPSDESDRRIGADAKLDGSHDSANHQLMGGVAVVCFRQNGQATVPQDPRAGFVKFVNKPAVVRVGSSSLLVRAVDVQVGLAREKIETMNEGFEFAADQRMDV